MYPVQYTTQFGPDHFVLHPPPILPLPALAGNKDAAGLVDFGREGARINPFLRVCVSGGSTYLLPMNSRECVRLYIVWSS